MKYTIKFDFPTGPAYPRVGGGFDNEISKDTRTWDDSVIAMRFAEYMCGKFGYTVIPVEENDSSRS
jgi:hypothetical protein